MKKKIISCICFWLIVLLLFAKVSEILIPSWNEVNGMPKKRTNDFYSMEEDTMDAMIFGSSYAYYSVSPLPIWNNYGITTYSFGNPSQRIWTTYYYMEEAFKYQSPKVVFYEVGTAHDTETPKEEHSRQNLDTLPFSWTKLKAIKEITDRNTETMPSYILPGLRYHSRWKELTEDDFTKNEQSYDYYGRGSLMRFGAKPAKQKNIDKWMTDTGENMVFPEENEKYIDMMLELCEENGAELVFVRFPEVYWTQNHHDMIAGLAKEKGVTFIDYNTFPEEYGLDWNTDTIDKGEHMNVVGNEKVSNYLGQYMKDTYGFEDKRSNPDYVDWVENAERFNAIYEKNSIANITNINQYLKKIKSDDCYTVIMAVKRGTTRGLWASTKKLLRSMGVNENMMTVKEAGYLAVFDSNEMIVQMDGMELLSWQDIVGDIKIDVKSGGRTGGNTASIKIDDVQYAADEYGLNIVVYDKELKRVVDSVAFDTTSITNKISRRIQSTLKDEF